mgnify:CR=1 FL=1
MNTGQRKLKEVLLHIAISSLCYTIARENKVKDTQMISIIP